ncbi:hypothetical protein [Pseudomonas atacamensis]|jgi:hypothetical protein|uniref:hypothetical protein n=1 Tax=Pseudomonas atacamensis TaxID=2565368 RepID=UPI000D810AC3|nr:hypothetical protein [Pseudomonas atacamensis]MDH2078207.1 hypothetical protein [Pseudomonas atacamensis]PYB95151.1 hypothetical protein DMX04_26055 [Pseudomonas koreensis]
MSTQDKGSNPQANAFTCQIEGAGAFSFPLVNAFRTERITITGADYLPLDQDIYKIEFTFDNDIVTAEYNLGHAKVKVDTETGKANIRYTPISMTLKLTVDHFSKSVSGVYAIDTVQDYGGVITPGIKLNGNFAVNYIDS